MIINFVGLPASGKTTTVRLLENKGLVKRIAFRNKLEIFFWFTLGYLRFPLTFTKGFVMVIKYRPEKYVLWNYYIVRYAYLGKATFNLNGCLAIDEPPLQNLYSFMVRSYSEDQLNSIYKNLPNLGYIIYFSITEDERIRRKTQRARNLPNEFDDGWETRLREADAFIKKKLSTHPKSYCFSGDLLSLELFLNSIRR